MNIDLIQAAIIDFLKAQGVYFGTTDSGLMYFDDYIDLRQLAEFIAERLKQERA